MNLSLSKRADYVIKAGIALARSYDGDSYIKVREIAAEMAIPRSYTPQILDALIQRNLVESRAGKTGGYRLTRHPKSITVLELLEAGEGPLKPENCALSDGPCRWDGVCPMHEVMSTAVNGFRATMGNESLSELASRDFLLERGELAAPADPHNRKDRMREFAAKSSTIIEAPRLQVLARLQSKDGEWLSVPMLAAIREAISKESLEGYFSAGALQNASLVVNLGYVHEQGPYINVPITIEASKSRLEVPRFVGNLSLVSDENGGTICEVNGRFEFNLVNPTGAATFDPETLNSLQMQLGLLAGRISDDFLVEVSDELSSVIAAS
ncbi:MAG: Rrf2 family transcriptional regulator [Actinomycetota bacterium]|jgi:Rrf2 family protein|nr:Rrf2 family transcriptional regulator [Actinomycetota bacterium]